MPTGYEFLTPQPQKPGLGERFMAWVKQNHAAQPSLGGELKAMAREAVKDVRDTMHEVFFNQKEGMGEPGTPLNPTQQNVTNDLGNFKGYNQQLDEAIQRGSSRQSHELER